LVKASEKLSIEVLVILKDFETVNYFLKWTFSWLASIGVPPSYIISFQVLEAADIR